VINLRTDRFKFSSPGIFGAKPAHVSAASLKSTGEAARPLTSKVAGLRLKKDDVLSMEFAGGGGWGDPRARAPERVQQDVVRGYVSREAASDDYGVALNQDFSVDADATAKLRTKTNS
jgi:N-methylhydantoinase B